MFETRALREHQKHTCHRRAKGTRWGAGSYGFWVPLIKLLTWGTFHHGLGVLFVSHGYCKWWVCKKAFMLPFKSCWPYLPPRSLILVASIDYTDTAHTEPTLCEHSPEASCPTHAPCAFCPWDSRLMLRARPCGDLLDAHLSATQKCRGIIAPDHWETVADR